jgi:hypothetical protein
VNDIFNNSRTLVKEIQDIAGLDLFAKPYSRYNPDDTTWWLIPGKEYPAYKYGKLFFEMTERGMFCGYHIEKGINTEDDLHYGSFQMNSEWRWNKFMANLRTNDEKLVSALKKFASNELKSHILVSAKLTSASGREKLEPALIEFEMDSNLNLHRQKIDVNKIKERIASYFITEFKDEMSISEFASVVSDYDMPNFDELWINVYFGVYIPPSKEDMTAVKLWKDYLEHWESWLRKHED